jgi:hypothetical protein
MTRKALVIAATALVGIVVFSQSSRGTSTDCLGRDYLSQGGFAITAEYSVDMDTQDTVRNMAKQEIGTEEPARIKLVDLAVDGQVEPIRRVYLVEVPLDGVPHELFGPVGAPAVKVYTPCSIVVFSEKLEYEFTYSFSLPVQ